MLTVLLAIIGILALCAGCFVLGAVTFALGCYQKIKDSEGELTAKRFFTFMKGE